MHVGVVSDVPWRSGQFDSNVVAHAVATFNSSVFCHCGLPIPVTVHCKAWVWGLSVAGTVVSNAAGGGGPVGDGVLCVVTYSSLLWADHSSRGVLPPVLCLSVIVKTR